jgi:transketolase
MDKDLQQIHNKIIDISYKYKASHISSCLTASNILREIYTKKKRDDAMILSSGHAFLALAAVLEWKYGYNAEELFLKHGTHPKRDISDRVYFSTGSLGTGICASLGFALADRTKDVYCLISDGECAEGSVWESLNFAREAKLDNLKVYVNMNGYTAYSEIDEIALGKRLMAFYDKINLRFTGVPYECLQGLQGHYKVLTEAEYNEIRY